MIEILERIGKHPDDMSKPFTEDTNEESTKSIVMSSDLVKDSSSTHTPILFVDSVDKLSKDGVIMSINRGGLNQSQLTKLAPKLFDDSSKNVQVVEALKSSSVVLPIVLWKKALQLNLPQHVKYNRIMVYKFHENEYDKEMVHKLHEDEYGKVGKISDKDMAAGRMSLFGFKNMFTVKKCRHEILDNITHENIVVWETKVYGSLKVWNNKHGKRLFKHTLVNHRLMENTFLGGYTKYGKMEVVRQYFQHMMQMEKQLAKVDESDKNHVMEMMKKVEVSVFTGYVMKNCNGFVGNEADMFVYFVGNKYLYGEGEISFYRLHEDEYGKVEAQVESRESEFSSRSLQEGTVNFVMASFVELGSRDVIVCVEIMMTYRTTGLIFQAVGRFKKMPAKILVSFDDLSEGMCQIIRDLIALDLLPIMVEKEIKLTKFNPEKRTRDTMNDLVFLVESITLNDVIMLESGVRLDYVAIGLYQVFSDVLITGTCSFQDVKWKMNFGVTTAQKKQLSYPYIMYLGLMTDTTTHKDDYQLKGEFQIDPSFILLRDVAGRGFRRGDYKELTSLKEYAMRMKFCQKEPFFVSGNGKEAILSTSRVHDDQKHIEIDVNTFFELEHDNVCNEEQYLNKLVYSFIVGFQWAFKGGTLAKEDVKDQCSKTQAPKQSNGELYCILNPKLGHVVKKMQKYGMPIYNPSAVVRSLNVQSNCTEATKLSRKKCFEKTVKRKAEIMVLKLVVGQSIKAYKSQDKKRCLNILVSVAQNNFHLKFFWLAPFTEVLPKMVLDNWSSKQRNQEFYLCALVGLVAATRLIHYHFQFDEGYLSTYAYQEFVHLVSCARLISITLIHVAALIMYAYWIASVTGPIRQFIDLLETSSSHVRRPTKNPKILSKIMTNYAGNPDTPDYVLYHYLCKRALDWFYARKVELYEDVKVLSLLKKEFDSENSCYHLRMAFEAYFPADKKLQIFHTSILFKARLRVHIAIVYVGQETQSPENLSDFAKEYISDSDDGDDREVSELNPAFIKKKRSKSPPCPQLRLMRRHPSRYESFGPGVLEEIEKFNTDVKNSGGFYAGHYPEMDAARIDGTWISKCYDIDNKPIPASSLTKLIHLSQLALCFYNMKEGTEFNNVKVVRAMTYNCGSTVYNLTFKASLSDNHEETFQTNIRTSFSGLPVNKITMVFVRINPN